MQAWPTWALSEAMHMVGAMRSSDHVHPPRIDPLVLGNLFDGEPELLCHGADLDGLQWSGLRGEGVDVHGSTTSGCIFEDVVADEFNIATSRVAETRFVQIGVPLFRMARSVFRDVEFEGGRLGAVEAYDLKGRALLFNGCRLNYLNLRGSTLIDVAFRNCQIDELDLGQATIERMGFVDSQIGALSMHNATLKHVDFRMAQLSAVNGASSLRGATISSQQLLDLAPQLAKEAGILVD